MAMPRSRSTELHVGANAPANVRSYAPPNRAPQAMKATISHSMAMLTT